MVDRPAACSVHQSHSLQESNGVLEWPAFISPTIKFAGTRMKRFLVAIVATLYFLGNSAQAADVLAARTAVPEMGAVLLELQALHKEILANQSERPNKATVATWMSRWQNACESLLKEELRCDDLDLCKERMTELLESLTPKPTQGSSMLPESPKPVHTTSDERLAETLLTLRNATTSCDEHNQPLAAPSRRGGKDFTVKDVLKAALALIPLMGTDLHERDYPAAAALLKSLSLSVSDDK